MGTSRHGGDGSLGVDVDMTGCGTVYQGGVVQDGRTPILQQVNQQVNRNFVYSLILDPKSIEYHAVKVDNVAMGMGPSWTVQGRLGDKGRL